MAGKHIDLFLVDGVSGGIATADVSGWTGHLLSGPRSDLKRLLAREDANTNGIYLLLGDDPTAVEATRCYIGKTENLSARLANHDYKKPWWNRAILISSREASFNEGHWGYLEHRMLAVAKDAERCSLDDNKQSPQPRKLSEAQISDAEDFLAQLRGVLPVLGVNILRTTSRSARSDAPSSVDSAESPVFQLIVPKRNVKANGRSTGDEFILLEGSQVVAAWTGSGTTENTRRAYATYRAIHAKLLADGSIRVQDGIGTVARDIPFKSPSTAGCVALGRSCNGRTSWTWDGGTYADWENRDLPSTNSD